ncbi:hypothetical protein [Arenimonas alkanexedens]
MILVIFAVMLVLGLLVGGLVLKFSVRMLQSFSPSYGKSVLVVFLAGVAGFIVNIVLTMAMGVGTGMGDPTAMAGNEAAMAGAMMASLGVMAISLLASLFITAFFVNLMIKAPDGRAIGFGRSCLVALLYLVVMVVLGIVAGIAIGIILAMLGVGAAGLAGMGG